MKKPVKDDLKKKPKVGALPLPPKQNRKKMVEDDGF